MSEPTYAGTSRPRRTTRAPAKGPRTVIAEDSLHPPTKRNGNTLETNAGDKLQYLLTNPKSKLTKVDITEILNYENFLELSQESQELLASLLPPTAFGTYFQTISPSHVDYQSEMNALDHVHSSSSVAMDNIAMEVDEAQPPAAGPSSQPQRGPHVQLQKKTPATLDPLTFNSPFLLSAARTYQDHLFSGWFGKKARETVAQFEAAVLDGSMHADWKDEVWEREHQPRNLRTQPVTFASLAECGFLQEEDVLSYRREFPRLGVVVEKDLLIDSIDQRTHTLTVLIPPSITRDIVTRLLVTNHPDPEVTDRMQLMDDVMGPEDLENGILDIDGRVRLADRYVANQPVSKAYFQSTGPANLAISGAEGIGLGSVRAWKAFTVWRWRDEVRSAIEMQLLQDRGGRERFGTLYYLRAYCMNKK